MKKTASYQIVTAGLLVAIGLVLPYFTSHMFAVPGTLLLPMHIPVLLCGLLCGPKYGALCGIIVPLLSSILTGMPPAFPMLPIMLVQLLVLGLLSGLFYQKLKLNIYVSILISMAAAWAAYGLMFALLMLTSGGNLRALSVGVAIVTGLPGIAIQLILCPLLVAVIVRATGGSSSAPVLERDALKEARDIIKNGDASCVVIKENRIVHTADGRGVSPLCALYEENPSTLKDALVVDKIIGKAAAVILVLGGASSAYGIVMSLAARDYLVQHDIKAEYDRCVDVISARSGSGICPIEKSILDIDDPQQAYVAITDKIKQLRSAS